MDRTCVPEEWTRQFGSASYDLAVSVSVGSDGSVLVAGYTFGTLPGQSSAGGQDAFVRKYDAAGAVLWTRQFGSASFDYAYSVSVGSDGSVLVAGYTGGTLPGQSSAGGRTRLCGSTMRRAPSSGRASLGPRARPRPVGERGQRRQRAGRGVHGRHLSGAIERRRPGRVCAEVRCGGRRGLDAPVWDREQRLAYSVSVGSDGSVLVAGHTDGTFPGQSSAGSTTRLCGSTMRRAPRSGRASLGARHRLRPVGERGQRRQRAGRGYTDGTLPGQSSAGGSDAFVRKYDAAGAEVWTRQFGTASNDSPQSVSVGSDGSVLVAGYTDGTLPGQSSAGGNRRVCAEVRCGGRRGLDAPVWDASIAYSATACWSPTLR
jgi:hypothetical protein